MLDAIVTYLLAGVPDAEVASIIGCSPKFVEQVKARPDYPAIVSRCEERTATETKNAEREKKYDSLEDHVLSMAREQSQFADFRDLTRMMETLIKRKQQPPPGMMVVNGSLNNNTNIDMRHQQVVLQMPQAAIPEIRLNGQREVIGIGSTSLAPMDSFSVRKLFSSMKPTSSPVTSATISATIEGEAQQSKETGFIEKVRRRRELREHLARVVSEGPGGDL